MRVRVLGGGVVGLTTALTLADRGFDVELVADRIGTETTSRIAAAAWYPFLAGRGKAVEVQGHATLRALEAIADHEPDAGVARRRGVEYLREEGARPADPAWARLLRHFEWLDGGALPPGVTHGYEFEVPLADTSVYLPWLERRVRAAVASVRAERYDSLRDAGAGVDVLVNCAGLEAGRLAGDKGMRPVWGQVVYVAKPPAFKSFVLDQNNPQGLAYVFPRTKDVVLGGSAVEGRGSEHVDEALSASIVRRCVELVPALRDAEVLGAAAGFRPVRKPGVRLELEETDGAVIVHNYGHGGSGFSLAHGCAEDVASLVTQWRQSR